MRWVPTGASFRLNALQLRCRRFSLRNQLQETGISRQINSQDRPGLNIIPMAMRTSWASSIQVLPLSASPLPLLPPRQLIVHTGDHLTHSIEHRIGAPQSSSLVVINTLVP